MDNRTAIRAIRTTNNTTPAGSQVILPTAPGVSNEGGRATLLVIVPAVSWPWVPAWGSLEPLVETVKTRKKREKTGGKWARYGLKRVKVGG